jgi:hypothetical protein
MLPEFCFPVTQLIDFRHRDFRRLCAWSLGAEHLSFLVDFLEAEYAAMLQEIRTFTSHGEIMFDLLWSIFLPALVIFKLCETTESRAVRLQGIGLAKRFMTNDLYWKLDCEYVKGNDSAGRSWGMEAITLGISHFEGVEKITNLKAYPMKWLLKWFIT